MTDRTAALEAVAEAALEWRKARSGVLASCARSEVLTSAQVVRLSDAEKGIERALAALDAAGPDGWRVIETAPKDGAEVDLFTREGRRLTDCWYHFDNRWVWRSPRINMIEQIPGTPTYWRPLPPPPAPREGGGE